MKQSTPKMHPKYIFVIGGVMSGVGKGIATSSIGTLLSSKGYRVNLVKVDPYLNVDAGTMNPTEHGEVFVLDSGLETDQDMGNYERFLGRDLTPDDYITSGMVYKHVIEKERALEFGGKCVEAIPHLRDEIVHRFEHAAKVNKSDISIIEIGGTVGDYQNTMFIEAARLLKMRHPSDVIFIMVSYLPVPSKLGEMKTRPTQHAVQQLSSYGVNTDIVIARADRPLDMRRKEKIASACNIPIENVISAPDIESIYDVPVNFRLGKIDDIVLKALHVDTKITKLKDAPRSESSVGQARSGDSSIDFDAWAKMARGIKNHERNTVNIAIVGKYFATGSFTLTDAYLSVLEAIKFSAYEAGVKVVIHAVNAGDFENVKIKNQKSRSTAQNEIDCSVLDQFDGIIVPGGFGATGIEGKLNVIRYARLHKIPYFGLCYGMQLLTVEYSRNVLNLHDAHTAEIDPRSPHPVIDIMPDQKKKVAAGNYGGSMRLGLYPAKLSAGSRALEAYWKGMENEKMKGKNDNAKSKAGDKPMPDSLLIKERHRHRYEVNPKYVKQLEKGGLIFSGKSPDGTLMEIAELGRESHPFFLGTQFHPEFLARPLSPHPLFTAFIEAAKVRNKENKSLPRER